MDLLERFFEGKLDFKKSVRFSQYKSDIDQFIFCDNMHKLYDTLKTDEQKALFNALETTFQERLEQCEKEMFLNGFSCGLKMGIEMNNRLNDFDFDKNQPNWFN